MKSKEVEVFFLFACEQLEVFSVFRYLRVSKNLLG